MTILQIHNEYKERGGEDAVVDNEQLLLEKAGHEVIRINVRNSQVGDLWETRRLWYQKLTLILESKMIEVAHLHNIYSVIGNSIYPILKKYNVPIVQTLHNYRFLCANAVLLDNNNNICERCAVRSFLNGIVKKCYRKSYSHSAFMAWQSQKGRIISQKYVDKFIAVSDFVKQKHVQYGFLSSQITVKSNYVSVPKNLGVIKDEGYALYMGRLSPEKGVKNLINVFVEIGYNLKIVGDGPLRSELENIASVSKNIAFLGHIRGEEKEKLIRESSFLVVPSECFETFGMVVQEAYAYKKVVLASNIGALPDHIMNKTHLFTPGSFSELFSAVEDQIREKQKHHVLNIQYNKMMTEDEATKALLYIYESVIPRKLKVKMQ